MSSKRNIDIFKKELGIFTDNFKKQVDIATGKVPLDKLFTLEFMQTYTNCDTLANFIKKYDSTIVDKPFSPSLTPEFESYIKKNSQFKNWEEMYQKAGQEYLIRNTKA